jgi:uncharacterized protein involved in copper resistance
LELYQAKEMEAKEMDHCVSSQMRAKEMEEKEMDHCVSCQRILARHTLAKPQPRG